MRHIQAELRVLSDGEIEQIHEASVQILSKIGLHVPNAQVCRATAALGAKTDGETVRIPSEALAPILAEARAGAMPFPRPDTPCGRLPAMCPPRYLPMITALAPGGAVHCRMCGTGSPSSKACPISRVQARSSCHRMCRCPTSCAIGKSISARARTAGPMSCRRTRHAISWRWRGSWGRTVSYLLDTVSPLSFTRESLEIGLLFAQAGMPLEMTPLVMAGSTAPVTLAGALTQQNAEVLGSLFLIYALTGKIAKYVGSAHSNDLMHSMMCSFGSPNQVLFGIATAQMAAFYGLASGSNSGLTDALAPDFQAGFEKSFSAVCSVLAGSDAIGGQGIVGADQGFSFAQLVLDDAWLDAMNYALAGFEVNEDTLGLDTLEQVVLAVIFSANFTP